MTYSKITFKIILLFSLVLMLSCSALALYDVFNASDSIWSCSGAWTNPNLTSDDNFVSYGTCSGAGANCFWNFTLTNVSSTDWRVAGGGTNVLVSLPAACRSQYPIQLNNFCRAIPWTDSVFWSCWNGTAWQTIYQIGHSLSNPGYVQEQNLGAVYGSLINASELAYIGEPCLTDAGCLVGKCLFGTCVLRGYLEPCSYDVECMSQRCLNNKCTKPSAWQLIDTAKTDIAGNDDNTNNLLALFLSTAFGVFVAIVIAGFTGAAVIAAGVGALVFMGFLVFFTFVGWLSAFILLGVIIMMALIITLYIILGS